MGAQARAGQERRRGGYRRVTRPVPKLMAEAAPPIARKPRAAFWNTITFSNTAKRTRATQATATLQSLLGESGSGTAGPADALLPHLASLLLQSDYYAISAGFEGREPEELSVRRGDVVHVLSKAAPGWCVCVSL